MHTFLKKITILTLLIVLNISFFCFALRSFGVDWDIIGGYSLVALALLLPFVPTNLRLRNLLVAAFLVAALMYMRLFWVGTNAFYFENQLLEILKHGNFNQDTAFNSAIAEMIKNYGVPSTGLHGTPYLHYHWGGNALLAGISKIINIPAVVAFPYFITFFAALMIGSLLLFCAGSGHLIQALFGLGCLQLANLNGHIFKCFDLGTSSAVILMGMTMLLLEKKQLWWRTALICLFTGLSLLSKGSVGCYLVVYSGLRIFFSTNPNNHKIWGLIGLVGCSLAVVFLVTPPGLSDSLKWEWGNQLKEWSGKNSGANLSWKWYYFMPVLLVAAGWENKRPSLNSYMGVLLCATVFIALNTTFYNTAGMHFVAGAMWFSLFRISNNRSDTMNNLICKSLAIGIAFYVLTNGADYIKTRVSMNVDTIQTTPKRTNADFEIDALYAERKNKDDYLIKIPEENLNFWRHWSYDGDSYSGRYFLAFWIPMLSGKPGYDAYNPILMKNKMVGWYNPGCYGYHSYYTQKELQEAKLKIKVIQSADRGNIK